MQEIIPTILTIERVCLQMFIMMIIIMLLTAAAGNEDGKLYQPFEKLSISH